MGDFLGTGRIADQLKIFRSYVEAKKYAQSLKFKTGEEWYKHTKSKNFPKDIKVSPNRHKEFTSMGDFLGSGSIAFRFKKYRSYKEAKKYAQSLKLKSGSEWYQHTKSKNFPKDIPVGLHAVYGKKFTSMGNFLGTGNVAPQLRKYRNFKEARKYAQFLKLKDTKEWRKIVKQKKFPKDMTTVPDRIYKYEFKGWGDFLGTGRKQRSRKN
jgi:predicted DNA-binding transcriptional regulator AlpA